MIDINGRPVVPEKDLTLARLLELAGLEARQVVVTVDGKFVPPSDYGKFAVPDGAKVKTRELLAGG